MKKKASPDPCQDPTQELSVEIPCRLAERIESYARQTGATVPQLVIEALDEFLREKIRVG